MEPQASPFTLNFRLFRIPFSIHPSFWGMSLLFGYLNLQGAPGFGQRIFFYLGIWVLVVLVGVIVHELGHVLTGLIFGQPGAIVLYSMGGAAGGQYHMLSPWKRLFVVAAGPGAGFALSAVAYWALANQNLWLPLRLQLNEGLLRAVQLFLGLSVWINLIWSIFNLFPVFPLDGGHLVSDFCSKFSPAHGPRIGLIISISFAGFFVLWSVLKLANRSIYYPPLDPMFNIVIFGMMGMQCFQMWRRLETTRARSRWHEEEW